MPQKITSPVNEGAYKAGAGQYIFELGDLDGILTGKKYSSAFGPVVEGLRTQVGLMHKEKGTGARPHSHPNEQWNYVVKGKLRVTIDDQEKIVGPGTLLYIARSRNPKKMSISSSSRTSHTGFREIWRKVSLKDQ